MSNEHGHELEIWQLDREIIGEYRELANWLIDQIFELKMEYKQMITDYRAAFIEDYLTKRLAERAEQRKGKELIQQDKTNVSSTGPNTGNQKARVHIV